MIEITDKSKCSGCYGCFNICPKTCIDMEKDQEGFWYPKVNIENCINCGLCEKICPIINEKHKEIEREPKAYAAYNQDHMVHKQSSSGGMFTLISKYVLDQNGVVFGVCVDHECKVIHDYIENIDEIGKFRGSKYVQSKVGNTYKKAKEFLDEGRLVFYTGTPCQIGGIYSYLRKDYKNLITQDIICHGVPSPKVWKNYVDFREGIAKSTTKEVSFRCKEEGWKNPKIVFVFLNDTRYCKKGKEDPMLKAFTRDVCLRPSCYSCSFKKKERQADITLGDFWGIEHVLPEMEHNMGTSLLILNSDKGKEIFEQINGNIMFKETELDKAVAYNSMMVKSTPMPKNRCEFMKEIDEFNFDKVVKKYCEIGIRKRIIKKLERMLRR